MKLNSGKNIITSKDITLVGDSANLGNDLDSVLVSQEEDILKLKSNVKWLYKYGGVGSGGGTSSGSTSSNTLWSAYISFANLNVVDGGTIVLSNPGSYTLSVSISNPQGREFTLRYKLGDGRYTSNYKLNSDCIWNLELQINISANTTLAVEIRDPNNEILLKTINIIAQAYKFEAYLVDNEDNKYTESNLFITDVKDKGLVLKIPYNIVVDYDECSLNISFNDKTFNVSIIDSYGTITKDLLELIPDISEDDAGGYKWTVDVNLKLSSSLESEDISELYQDIQLIPNNFYILVSPVSGTIYKTPQDPDTAYIYQVGTINLNLLIYNGKVNAGKTYNINVDVEVDDVLSLTFATAILERTKSIIQINCVKAGSYKITLTYGTNYTKYIYLYTFDKYADVDYYAKGDVILLKYYRTGIDDTILLCNEAQYKMQSNGQDVTVNNLNILDYSGDFATIVHFGLKFSKINSTENKLFTIDGGDHSITFYPSKVYIDSSEKTITINKCSNFNTDNDDYHLITFAWHKVASDNSNNVYYEKVVYIDGILEAAWEEVVSYYLNVNSITLHPANYYINLLEVDYILNYDYNDIDKIVVNFSNAYQLKKLQNDDNVDLSILNVLKENPYKFENNTIILNSTAVSNMSTNSKVPVMLFTIPSSTLESVVKDCNGEITEFNMESFLLNMGDSGSNYPNFSKMKFVSNLYYAEAGEDVLSDACNITKKFSLGSDIQCYFEFQGSSTYIFNSKNLAVGLQNSTDADVVTSIPVFTPNYNSKDTSTFLPETKFNLKADVVDSSHSNNNACGRFINSEMPRLFNDITYKYNSHIKNCLEGFPVIVLLNFMNKDGSNSSDYYLLGIYNFNLSRDSYFNLGYSDLEDALDGQTLEDGFNIYQVKCDTKGELILRDNLWVVEIQENTPGFDFSQYDKTVLFPLDTATLKDTSAMFGDMVYSNSADEFLNKVQSFVESTTKAGAYVFTYVGKNFGSLSDNYSATFDGTDISKNLVPDYKYQYTRTIDGFSDSPTFVDYTPQESDLVKYVSGDIDNSVLPIIDYESLVNAFVGIMALGLVDSILKNSNWKSWGSSVKAAFYDMDTCFGVDNSGRSDVDFKAFTDYWKPNIDEDSGKVLSTTIYRDYNPALGYHGFDIPSSYIWAIAKYASSCTLDYANTLLDPLKLWYRWRNATTLFDGVMRNGPFYTADDFIDNFYRNHTKDIDPMIKNLNYRFKYFKLLKDSTGYSFDNTNFSNFNGTRIEYVRDWLDSRLHFLDMCFNLQAVKLPILECNLDTQEYTSIPGKYYNNTVSTSLNTDVIVCRDIFTLSGQEFKINGYDFAVTANNYSPLVITTGESSELYLLEDISTTYSFSKIGTGQISTKFGGSSNWQTINDVSSFVNGYNLYINSAYLQRIQCTRDSKTITSVTLNTPSLKEITFAGNTNASAKLSFVKDLSGDSPTDSYPNLTSIDISGTKMSLEVNGEGVQTINISNVNSSSISIINCDSLQTLTMNGTMTINTLALSYGDLSIGRNVTFDSLKIKSYSILRNGNDTAGTSCTIKNDSTVTSIVISNYETVTIQNCQNLKSVSLDSTVKYLTISSCYGTFSFDITKFISGSLFDFNDNGVLDLSGLKNLETLYLYNTKGFYKVILPDKNVNLKSDCFRSTWLRYLDIAGNNGVAYIAGTGVFRDAPLYQMKNSDGSYSDVKVKNGITNISTTFYLDASSSSSTYVTNSTYKEYCKLTSDDVLYFIDNWCIPEVTDISYLFFNRGIDISLSEGFSDYSNKKSRISLSKLVKVINALYCFALNNIMFWNKYMFRYENGTTAFGNDSGVSMRGFLQARTFTGYYATYDYLETIASKIDMLCCQGYEYNGNYSTGYIRFVDYLTGELITDEVTISRFLCYEFPKLKYIFGFSIDADTIDFENAFDNTLNIEKIQYSFSNSKIAKNFEGAFYKLEKLYILADRSLTFSSDSAAVDLYELIDWDNFLSHGGNAWLFDDRSYTSTANTVNINTYISRADYEKLWEQILASKIVRIASLFKNCTLTDSVDATIPETGVTNSTITSMYATFYNFKGKDDGFVLFDGSFFKRITSSSINLFRCFLGTKWANAIPFNFFNCLIKSLNTVVLDDAVYGTLITYTYSTRKFNLDCCWQSCTFGSGKNYFDDENSVLPNKIVALNGDESSPELLDINREPYTKYKIGNTSYTFTQNTQYLDILRLTFLETGASRNASVPFKDLKLFVSPDILYNVSGEFRYCFYGTGLCGSIPWNLTKNCKSKAFNYAFSGLDIIPYRIYKYDGDTNNGIFLFVPDNFTTYNTLNNAFNFTMRVPAYNSDSTINSIYLICSQDSIGTISRMLDAMPVASSGNRNIFYFDDLGNASSNSQKITALYNFMGKVNTEDGTVTYGINSEKLKSANFSNMFNAETIAVTKGKLVDYTVTTNTSIDSGYYMIYVGWSGASLYVSSLIQLPRYTSAKSNYIKSYYNTKLTTELLTNSSDKALYNNISNIYFD